MSYHSIENIPPWLWELARTASNRVKPAKDPERSNPAGYMRDLLVGIFKDANLWKIVHEAVFGTYKAVEVVAEEGAELPEEGGKKIRKPSPVVITGDLGDDYDITATDILNIINESDLDPTGEYLTGPDIVKKEETSCWFCKKLMPDAPVLTGKSAMFLRALNPQGEPKPQPVDIRLKLLVNWVLAVHFRKAS